jgi:hypothetical protein
MCRFASGKTAAQSLFPKESLFVTLHIHDAATKNLFHLIGSPARQTRNGRASAEFPHKLLARQQKNGIFLAAVPAGGTNRKLRGRRAWPATVP